MKLLHISDTHGSHSALDETIKMLVESNDIDVIIHSGDFMHHAMKYMDYESFIEWFKSLPIEHKILVPGNHDMWCEQLEFDQELRKAVVPDDVHLLINESIQIKGINFWGSPYTPEFFNWGFQLYGTEGYELWAKIPENTDVLITHGPSMGGARHVANGRVCRLPIFSSAN
ncbi:hypothetical protein JCM30760_10150 [Thiomicrorhabdus hydrogeniphila]